MFPKRSRVESTAAAFKRLGADSGAGAPPTITGAALPTLWAASLSTALSAIATEDVDRLADALIDDPPLRAALKEGLLRRARHIGDLADDDLMEVVISSCCGGGTQQFSATLRVKTLPFRLRAAAKLFFREACAAPIDAPPSGDVCRFTDDGRLEFTISEVDFLEREEGVTTEWENKYLEVIGGVAREIGVPPRDSMGIVPVAVEPYVSLKRYFPHLERDTLEYDAHELVINDRTWALRQARVDDDFCTYFFDECNPKVSEHVGKHAEHRDAVWVRKPRIRFVVEQRCECPSEADDEDEDNHLA